MLLQEKFQILNLNIDNFPEARIDNSYKIKQVYRKIIPNTMRCKELINLLFFHPSYKIKPEI